MIAEYRRQAEDLRRVVAEFQRQGVFPDKQQAFTQRANELEAAALKLYNLSIERGFMVTPQTIVAIDGDRLTLGSGQIISKRAGSPAWGYKVGDEIRGFPSRTVDRPVILIDENAGTPVPAARLRELAKRELMKAMAEQLDQQIRQQLVAAPAAWIKRDEVAAEFPSAAVRSYERDPKTGEIRATSGNAAQKLAERNEAVRYILADPAWANEATAISELAKMGSPWNGIDAVFGVTKSDTVNLWRSWRRGDRLALISKWFDHEPDIFRNLQRLFSDGGYREIARADVQVWTAPPLEPMDLALGPLALNVDPRVVCAQCGKPAFTHRYRNDNTSIYGDRGIWDCLSTTAEPEKPARGYLGIERSNAPQFSAQQLRVFGQLQGEYWSTPAGRIDSIEPEPAKPKPAELLKRTNRSYDDDF